MSLVLKSVAVWAALYVAVYLIRYFKPYNLDRQTPRAIVAEEAVNHFWLLLYEPVHTASRVWFRIKALGRTLWRLA